MSSEVISNSFRFFLLLFIQVLILKNIEFGWDNFNYVQIIIYPVAILLLPFRTPHALLILIAFALGILVDLFYNSLGVHASAAVFMAFLRPMVLKIIEPRGGYNLNLGPSRSRLGMTWYLTYSAPLFFLHLFWYFSVEAFTFYYFDQIILRTIASFFVSYIFVLMYQYMLDPRN